MLQSHKEFGSFKSKYDFLRNKFNFAIVTNS